MRKLLLSGVLASVALPAIAADMPLKAPRPAEAIIADWSGVYSGFAVGGAWGREKLDRDVGLFDNPTLSSSQLFGTSATRIFESNVLIQPPFVMDTCLLSNCNTIKMSGIMAGGFAGVQKQWGNWVPAELTNETISPRLLELRNERPVTMARVGKKLAGRILDGTTWDGLPYISSIHA